MKTIYDAAGGRQAFIKLAHAWHERVMADPVVAHAFSHGFQPDHSERLAAYWAENLGGPPEYTTSYGDETSVLRIHAGNGEHEDMDRRSEARFDDAVDNVGLPDDERLRSTLKAYFRWANAGMAAHPSSPDDVAPGLPMRRWSWDGPESV